MTARWSLGQGIVGMGLVLSMVLTAGCSQEQVELQEWMDQARREARPNITPLVPPKKFNPQPYDMLTAVEPFSNRKLTVALKQELRQPSSLLAAELNRRKEPLESYPLDTIVMVGSVVKKGQQFGLIRIDNLLYQVRAGQYMGQNYGRVTGVTESAISLREIVQDAIGEWVERTSTLELQAQAR
jgi:type IV pilus assembly protein PilP